MRLYCVERNNSGDCNDVEQQNDQQRAREFHARLGEIVVIGRGGADSKWAAHRGGAKLFAFELKQVGHFELSFH